MRAFNVFSVFLSVFVYMLSRNKVFPEKLMALITKKKIFFLFTLFFFNKTRSSHKDASIESHKLLLPQPAIEKKMSSDNGTKELVLNLEQENRQSL